MTTLISLILIPLDLIAADWTIKWAKMIRRRSGNVWATTTEGRPGSGGARLRETPVLEDGLSDERSKSPTLPSEEGAKNGHYFSLHSPPSTIKSSPDNCSGLNRDEINVAASLCSTFV